MRALFILLLVIGGRAQATEFQFELGQCRFGLEGDGTFWQSDRYTRNYVTPRCTTIGLADRFGTGPFGWRVGFVTTGQIETRDNVATVFDADAYKQNLVCNNVPRGGHGCIASVNGGGHTWGFSLSATYEYRTGPATFLAESGLFFFRHSYHSHPKHIDCTNCIPLGDYDESSGPLTNPSPLVGLTIKVGYVYAAARYYWPAEHRALSLTDHSFLQLSSGFVVKF